jgi:hypothetical protein
VIPHRWPALNFSALDPEQFVLRRGGLILSCVPCELLPQSDVELSDDVAQVGLDGRQADDEYLGDLPVGHALGSEFGNATLGAGARLLPEIRADVPTETTRHPRLHGKLRSGSDGTRTRDLRRDRPAF